MTDVALFDAKNRFSELIERVLTGEEFVITRRGKVVARLVPPEGMGSQQQARQSIAALRACRAGISLGGMSSAELIREGRR